MPVGEGLSRKLEVRYRGPNVTPGYWRAPEQSAEAFDDEGFLRSGDAVRWLDPFEHDRGFVFDGRIAEDFKLNTGTWVSVGPLRQRVIAAGSPYVSDVVITGHDRREIGMLIVPNAPHAVSSRARHTMRPSPMSTHTLKSSRCFATS